MGKRKDKKGKYNKRKKTKLKMRERRKDWRGGRGEYTEREDIDRGNG